MRGEEEISCLTWVKQNLYGNSVQYYCDDLQRIIRILKSAEPNPAQSSFPDFLFEDGFIEHFQITASKETRKGALHKQTQAQFHNEVKQRFQILCNDLNSAPPSNSLSRETAEMKALPYSYEMYEASFKKNWHHHIKSLNKYTGSGEIGIFLIEYQGPLFKLIRDGKLAGFYKFHEDASMLRYIAEYQNKLSYMIYKHLSDCEIIEMKNIPALIEQAPHDIQYEPGRWKEVHINMAVDIMIDGSVQ